MIYEITGQPGHGKTLYGLSLARDFRKQGREVYVHGVTDLNYAATGFLKLEKPEEWEYLPDNAVVVIDECYSVFPNRNVASKVPDYIEALARHRHRGFDFILIHQQPNQVDPFVRGLVDTHHHVRRKFGLQAAVIKTWDYSTPSPIKDKPLRAPTWRYDKSIYALYTSATMHTVKRTIPWQIWAAIPIAGYVAWMGYRLLTGDVIAAGSKDPPAATVAPATAPAGVGAVGAREVQPSPATTAEQWLMRFVPRVPEYPMSAPAWDEAAKVVSEPRIACMIGETVGCICKTEQGTAYEMDQFKCAALVEAGGLYDPFKRPDDGYAHQQSERGSFPGQERANAGKAAVVSADLADLEMVQ